MYHKVILAGNLGKDPEMRYLPDGTAVTNFNMAVSDGWGENKKTIWFRVTCWKKRAETANQYLNKGSKVLVEGRMNSDDNGGPRTWSAQDGTVRASFEVTADSLTFLQSKAEAAAENTSSGGQQSSGGYSGGGSSYGGTTYVDEDDIPF